MYTVTWTPMGEDGHCGQVQVSMALRATKICLGVDLVEPRNATREHMSAEDIVREYIFAVSIPMSESYIQT